MSNKDLAAEYFDAVWSQHYDPEKIRLLADPALLWRYPMHGEFHGPESVIAMLTSFRESLPDLTFWATEELVPAGDYVVARWEGGGTHTGKALTELPYGGPIPAGSGRKVFFKGMSLLRFRDGKVIEDVGEEGAIDAHLQLGAVVANAPSA
ncbi:MAG TPA: ester cyclase [Mycobacterium sp.]|uniref:ester cyclase n=1 Tax=Mycobacterium sp. TaxID=1785 RepID=UPI002BC6C6F0|nr:ester cyclase [Mycobacterium sp.]HXO80090.1 ester cyclase [Mycobacterium sp.]